jgi:hypothetical protein
MTGAAARRVGLHAQPRRHCSDELHRVYGSRSAAIHGPCGPLISMVGSVSNGAHVGADPAR